MFAKWNIFKEWRFSLQSLLVMINRLENKDFDIEKEVVECHSFARLVLIKFIHDMLEILTINVRILDRFVLLFAFYCDNLNLYSAIPNLNQTCKCINNLDCLGFCTVVIYT